MENRQFQREEAKIKPFSDEKGQKGAIRRHSRRPITSIVVLLGIVCGCLFCDVFVDKAPNYMDFKNYNLAPNREFPFGTDAMGRDIFAMVWYGGRVSLFIGFTAAAVSAIIAIIFGAVSGFAPQWLDALLMRLAEILLSVPNLLLIVLVQAALGSASVWSISFVIGITSWVSIAKVTRTEVQHLRSREYIIASKCLGAGFFHILWQHLVPNLIAPLLSMVVMNVRNAIITESTLSFMGIGLPLEVLSWGSMLAASQKALLSGAWWSIFIPGLFLIVTMMCITNLGNYLRDCANHRQSNF